MLNYGSLFTNGGKRDTLELLEVRLGKRQLTRQDMDQVQFKAVLSHLSSSGISCSVDSVVKGEFLPLIHLISNLYGDDPAPPVVTSTVSVGNNIGEVFFCENGRIGQFEVHNFRYIKLSSEQFLESVCPVTACEAFSEFSWLFSLLRNVNDWVVAKIHRAQFFNFKSVKYYKLGLLADSSTSPYDYLFLSISSPRVIDTFVGNEIRGGCAHQGLSLLTRTVGLYLHNEDESLIRNSRALFSELFRLDDLRRQRDVLYFTILISLNTRNVGAAKRYCLHLGTVMKAAQFQENYFQLTTGVVCNENIFNQDTFQGKLKKGSFTNEDLSHLCQMVDVVLGKKDVVEAERIIKSSYLVRHISYNLMETLLDLFEVDIRSKRIPKSTSGPFTKFFKFIESTMGDYTRIFKFIEVKSISDEGFENFVRRLGAQESVPLNTIDKILRLRNEGIQQWAAYIEKVSLRKDV